MRQGDAEFVKSFPFNNLSPKVKEENLAALLYSAGHVARKARSYNDCTECKDLFGNKESTIDLDIDPKYLEYLDRGGLIYPSNLLFKILQVSYNIFNVFVGEDLEDSFLKLGNQKHTLINIIQCQTIVELCNIRDGLSFCDGLTYNNIICILNALCLQ